MQQISIFLLCNCHRIVQARNVVANRLRLSAEWNGWNREVRNIEFVNQKTTTLIDIIIEEIPFLERNSRAKCPTSDCSQTKGTFSTRFNLHAKKKHVTLNTSYIHDRFIQLIILLIWSDLYRFVVVSNPFMFSCHIIHPLANIAKSCARTMGLGTNVRAGCDRTHSYALRR